MVTKKRKAKERKATIIFIVCLLGVIVLITIIGILAQIAENRKPKIVPIEPETCMRAVTYTDAKTGKPMYVELADGYCVANDETYLGECSRVDSYGKCYDENNGVIKKSELIKY